MKYTVIIKNNESGEIIHDVECNAIVAGLSLGDCAAVSVGISSCNVSELLSAYKAAETASIALCGYSFGGEGEGGHRQ